MSEPSDKEQIYAITRFLDGLSDGQSATAKATIAELNTKLSSIFSTDLTNVNDFLALDYGSDVSSILEAGAKSLNVSTFWVFIPYCCDFKYIHPLSHFYFVFWFDQAGLYDTDLAEAKTNPLDSIAATLSNSILFEISIILSLVNLKASAFLIKVVMSLNKIPFLG